MEFNLISPRELKTELLYNTYDMWKRIWGETNKEVFSKNNINSTPFSKADKIGVLSKNTNPVGIHVYNFFSVNCPIDKEAQYFSVFPEQTKDILEDYEKIMSLEYLCMNENYRKVATKKLIGCSLSYFLRSNADLCLGVTNNNRKVNQMAVEFGAKIAGDTFQLGKYDSNIIYFTRDSVNLNCLDKEDLMFVDTVWNEPASIAA